MRVMVSRNLSPSLLRPSHRPVMPHMKISLYYLPLLKNDPGAFDNQNHGVADRDLQFVPGILVACDDKR
jgi:hypothetical protein